MYLIPVDLDMMSGNCLPGSGLRVTERGPGQCGAVRYVHYREDLRLNAGLDVPKTWEKVASRAAPAEGECVFSSA